MGKNFLLSILEALKIVSSLMFECFLSSLHKKQECCFKINPPPPALSHIYTPDYSSSLGPNAVELSSHPTDLKTEM